MKILTILKHHIYRLHNKLEYILTIFLINYQRFCKQWYDQAAQPQNMTFSQCKSCADKSFDLDNFQLISISLRLVNSR